jgi:hypothetical protein
MTNQPVNNVTDTLKYIYGEDLLGPDKQPMKHSVTIKDVLSDEFCDNRGIKTAGFSLVFEGAKKMLGVTGVTVTRQLVMATGTKLAKDMIGKKITLYPVPSKKSVSGWAVRIDVNGGGQ